MASKFIFSIVMLSFCFAFASDSHAKVKTYSFTGVELTQPPIEWDDMERVWLRIKKEVGAPENLTPPPLVLDWEVPFYAKMGFQYPTEKFPNNRMQISIAPRTLDMLPWHMILYGIGHELTHYVQLMKYNDFNLKVKFFLVGSPHHCDIEFRRITDIVADEIWNIYHSDTDRNQMFNEGVRSCAKFSGQ